MTSNWQNNGGKRSNLSWSQKITFFNKFFHTFLSRFNLFDRNWNYLHNFDQIQKFMIKKNFYILFTIWICLKFCNSKFLCFCCPIQPWILQTAIIIGPRGEATQLNEINEMRSKNKMADGENFKSWKRINFVPWRLWKTKKTYKISGVE